MQNATLIDDRKIQSIDRKIVNYLAALCGKHPRRFCAPSLDRVRFCAAWAMSDSFIEERLAYLVGNGRIDRAIDEVNGTTVEGFHVLPTRLFERGTGNVASSELDLTVEDVEFLQGCGIATR